MNTKLTFYHKATLVDPTSFDYLSRDMNRKPTSSLDDHFVPPSNRNMTTQDFSQKLVSGDKKYAQKKK